MKSSTLLLKLYILFIVASLSGVNSLEVILDRNFQKKTKCIEGIENNVFFLSGDPMNMNCELVCRLDQFDNNEKLATLNVINGLGLEFKYPMTTYSEPYSYIQADFTYVIPSLSNNFQIDINGLKSATVQTSNTKSIYEDSPDVLCGSEQFILYTTSLVLDQKLGAGVDLSIKLNDAYSMIRLRSVKITKNCTANCSKCLNDQSCSTCFDGYQKVDFPSGPTVCEQVGVCNLTSDCFSCAKYNGQEICLKCNQGFTLNSSSKCDANAPAPATACKTNEYNEKGQCYQYSSKGYYENRQTGDLIAINPSDIDVQLTYKCPRDTLAIVKSDNSYQNFQCRCMFENCVGCSIKESCNYCVVGMKFDYQTKSCVKLTFTQNNYKLVQKVTDTGYTLSFVFDNELVITEIDEKNLNIEITNFKNYTYKYQGIKDKNTLVVDVTCNGDVKNENVQVTISDNRFLTQNLMEQKTVEQPLEAYVTVSASDKAAAQSLNTAGGAISKTVVGSLLPIAFIGNFYVLINTIDLTGFLYYLLFVNVRYPINIFQFYDIFKNFQMAFIPNFFSDMVGSDYTQQAPPQFMQQQTDSYFLNNSGQSISVYLIIMGLYVLAKIFSGIDIKYVQAYCKRACYETWEFGGMFDAIWSVYIYILIGVLLQFYIFDCSDSSCGFNYFMFTIWVLICLATPILVTYLIFANPNVKDDKYMRVKISSLISGLKLFSNKESLIPKESDQDQNTPPQTNNLFPNLTQSQSQVIHPQEQGFRQKLVVSLSKYNMAILYIRKVIFSLIIVYMYEYSYAQLILISIMNIFIAAYYIVVQPFESKYENFKNAASEFLLISVQIIIGLLVEDPNSQPESDRIRLGWIAIGLIAFVIGWHALGIVFDFLYGIFQYIKSLKQRRNRVKVANFDQHEEANQEGGSPSSQAKKRLTYQQRMGSLAFQNVEEMPGEDEEDATNMSPLQSNRMKRAKFSQLSQVRREGSINNLDTFVDNTNISPEQSPTRKRASRLSVTNANSQQQQPLQQQQDHAQESVYDIPYSNNQMIKPEETRNSNKRFTKIRNILES